MDQYRFWSIVERANRESGGNDNKLVDLIEEQLMYLPLEEVLLFEAFYDALSCRSYQKRLWRELRSIYGFVSDDGFEYFRDWLISRGEGIFCEVMKNVGRLREFLPEEKKHCPGLESLRYVAECICEVREEDYMTRVTPPVLVGYDWLQKDRIEKGDV